MERQELGEVEAKVIETHRNLGRLAHVELAAIGLSIAKIQTPGHTADVGVANLSEGNREIVEQITARVGQLTARTSLRELEHARGEVVRGTAVSGG